MSPVTVVNLRDFPSTIHLYPDGKWRKGRMLPPDIVRIDRRTRWGNPYRIGDRHPQIREPLTRSDVITLYRGWLDGRLRWDADADPTFLDPLKGKRLACWCAPLPCHGDVIAEFLTPPVSVAIVGRSG